MKKLAVFLAVVALATCAATAVYADTINLSENWYIKITNFSLNGGGELPNPLSINATGFSTFWSYKWSSTSLAEPKLQNLVSSNPDTYSTLLFDFHAGTISTNDYVRYEPFATVGSIWSGTMSFNWEVHCSDPRVLFSVDAMDMINGGDVVSWSAPTGNGNRSGSATFSTGTVQGVPPGFDITFASVPEPTSLIALLVPISLTGVGYAFRRSRK